MARRLDADAVADAFGRVVEGVADLVPAGGAVVVVGVRTRGETLAGRLRRELARRGFDVGGGALDITLYRDDLSEIGPRPVVRPTDIPAPIDGATVVLVDDVLFTGRSVRAALTELADLGRPAAVRLAVLVDRGGRELPIRPDVVGLRLDARGGRVNVRLAEDDGADAIEVIGGGDD